MHEPRWTLDELAERVDAALAVDYQGQPSGRVRAVPDRRAIRWYTTIGLIDRPVAHRGRTALYGPRHLLQLVAVKRLQAKGLPLVAIQRELAGATDSQLAGVARIPAGGPPLASSGSVLVVGARDGGGPTGRASAEPGAAGTERPAATAQPPAAASRVGGGSGRRASFWRDRPAAAVDAPAGATARPTVVGSRGPATLRGVRLGDGATLLLEPGRELAVADLDAILDAARPLLAALRDRGLAEPAERPGHGPDPVSGHLRGNEARREHP